MNGLEHFHFVLLSNKSWNDIEATKSKYVKARLNIRFDTFLNSPTRHDGASFDHNQIDSQTVQTGCGLGNSNKPQQQVPGTFQYGFILDVQQFARTAR
jgi:hypothetical protein